MAHFAEIDKNNIVLRIIVVDDIYQNDGQNYLANECDFGGTWIQTSYNTRLGKHNLGGKPLRANYAGIGYIYHPDLDIFSPPQPYPSWDKLDAKTGQWNSPISYPTDGKIYEWEETSKSWITSNLQLTL